MTITLQDNRSPQEARLPVGIPYSLQDASDTDLKTSAEFDKGTTVAREKSSGKSLLAN